MIWNIFRYTGGIKRSNRDNPDFIYIILKVFVHKRTIKHAFLPTKSALLPVVIKFQRSAQLNTYLCSFLLLFIKTTDLKSERYEYKSHNILRCLFQYNILTNTWVYIYMATNKAPQLNSLSQCIHQYTSNLYRRTNQSRTNLSHH